MELLYDFPTYPEPHYGQIIAASKIKPEKIYPLAENKNPAAVKAAEEVRIVRKGKRVDVYALAVRTHFTPDIIRVGSGDEVYFHLTNLEQDIDITHGFGILNSNIDMQVEPGETKTARWVAGKPGIVPFYCSNFCSALHQEMQGYIEVTPAGTKLASVERLDARKIAEIASALGR